MKFAKHLQKEKEHAWQDFYIPYDKLKELIKTDPLRFRLTLLESLKMIDRFYLKVESCVVDEKEKIARMVDFKNKFCRGSENGCLYVERNRSVENVNFVCDDLQSVDNSCNLANELQIDDDLNNNNHDLINYNNNHKNNINNHKNNSNDDDIEKVKQNINENIKEENIKEENIKEENSKEENSKGENIKGKNIKEENNNKNTKKVFKSFDDNHTKKTGTRFNFLSLFLQNKYKKHKKEKKVTQILKACSKLKNYRTLNYLGFRKILKKYDKSHGTNLTEEILPAVKNSYFNKSKRIESVYNQFKNIYKEYFANNNKKKAKDVFENLVDRDRVDQLSCFLSGSFFAISIFLLHLIKYDAHKKMFIALNFIFYGALLFGCCMLIFKKTGISYGFIFDYDITKKTTINSYLFLISLFWIINNLGFYLNFNPLVLIGINMGILFFPFKILFYSTRSFFFYSIFKIIVTPSFSVQFKHFYIADCLLSFTFCYKIIFSNYFQNENFILFIILLPLWFRILQCLRRSQEKGMKRIQMLNALKYVIALSFLVVSYFCTSDLKLIFLKFLLGLISSFYSLYWDFFMDWEIKRKERMFHRSIHILIGTYNILCRFTWVILHFFSQAITDLDCYFAFAEITRRFLWTVIRVESEHLNNKDKFKVLGGIQIEASDLFYKADDEDSHDRRDITDNESCYSENENSENESFASKDGCESEDDVFASVV